MHKYAILDRVFLIVRHFVTIQRYVYDELSNLK